MRLLYVLLVLLPFFTSPQRQEEEQEDSESVRESAVNPEFTKKAEDFSKESYLQSQKSSEEQEEDSDESWGVSY